MSCTVLDFRNRFPEFSDDAVYPDVRIQWFLVDAVLLYMGSDESRWCNKYDVAQCYLAAHLLTVGTSSESGDSSAKAGLITSKTAGGVSVPRKVSDKSRTDMDDFLASTVYGQQFLSIRNMCFIGVMVANDAIQLGMEVIGFDPFISVESAWGLSKSVKRANVLESLISESDYISLHVPLTEQTKGMINQTRLALMKNGVRILNFARGGLVNNEDLIKSIKNGTVACYVTDFVDEELLKIDQVIGIPHLGASTPEAEDN